jgi:CheY-like chemotaxis protein
MINTKMATEELTEELTEEVIAKIMIVDDHPMVAATLARVLKNSDMPVEVLIAQDGIEALKILQDTSVDILITDFLMPRMTGLELGKNLKELMEKRGDLNSPYIILMTAYDTPGLEVSARQLDFNEFLVKPINPKNLRDIVNAVLEKKSKRLSSFKEKSSGNGKFQLLVADDIPENIRLLTKMVSSENYDYLIARDGQEALDVLRKELPDLVLLDINMPKLNGFEVLKEMRADPKTEHIPVIIITAARIRSSDIEEGLILGADDYVTKPINWRELSARIKTKLRVKEQSDKLREKNSHYNIASRVSRDLQAKIHEIKHRSSAGYFDSGSIKNHGLNEVIKIILDKALVSVGAATGSLTFANADGG